MRRAVVLASIAHFAGIGVAAAQDPCSAIEQQQPKNACITDAFRKADAVLNGAYGEFAGKLDALGKRNLIAAERAWIIFRDAECDFRSGYDSENLESNGTIAPFLVGQCKLALTLRRTSELREQLKCPGGNLSCEP